MPTNWSHNESKKFYKIATWGYGYYNIDKDGDATVQKNKKSPASAVKIKNIITHARTMGVNSPVIIRFLDIIKHRIQRIGRAFTDVKSKIKYTANYFLIYPIKANQVQTLVESVYSVVNTGLEAGSKAELIAVLSTIKLNSTPIICNGYKDYDYILTALIARKAGRKIFIVIEKLSEVQYVIEIAKKINVDPLLGMRVRLTRFTTGKWADSGGENSKFGLNSIQVFKLIEILKVNNLLNSLKLLHCHQGSQIADIHDIRLYIEEFARIYVDLYTAGIPIKTLDIGGGLAIDYDGTKSTNSSSSNYSLTEYATAVLSTIKEITTANKIPEPDVYSESGRAIIALHSIIVTDIADIESISVDENINLNQVPPALEHLCSIYQNLSTFKNGQALNLGEIEIGNIRNKFSSGLIKYKDLALSEQIFANIKLLTFQGEFKKKSKSTILQKLDINMAHKMLINLSIFQSMPDVWAINQFIPILPLSQLNNKPIMCTVIQDITCDSDGKIVNHISNENIEESIRLPLFDLNEPYKIAFYITGAYQETMGNMHNLFGPTNAIDVYLDNKGGFSIESIQNTYKNSDALIHFDYDIKDVENSMLKLVNECTVDSIERGILYKMLKDILNSSSYLRN
jgi:arginine decarboxylase